MLLTLPISIPNSSVDVQMAVAGRVLSLSAASASSRISFERLPWCAQNSLGRRSVSHMRPSRSAYFSTLLRLMANTRFFEPRSQVGRAKEVEALLRDIEH